MSSRHPRSSTVGRASFADFDSRGYRFVTVPEGYAEWVATYEDTVKNEMDIQLLNGLTEVPWHRITHAADLGCGTGRTGQWLRNRGIESLDGVDITPQMLTRADERGIYERLVLGDVTSSGLDAGAYDLITTCLVDEHLAELEPLYREASRLAQSDGFHVVVGYHPHFIMAAGMPTHYDRPSGEPVAIETYVHLLSDHVQAGLETGWTLVEMRERVIDEAWIALKPKWRALRGHPISFAMAWRKSVPL
jgi:SAM-dependent methyltransferase